MEKGVCKRLIHLSSSSCLKIFFNLSVELVPKEHILRTNYRSVSLTSVPCKILECIVCANIMAHLDEQTGNMFLEEKKKKKKKKKRKKKKKKKKQTKNRSCETQLITVINNWTKSLDAGSQVDTVILDREGL